MKTSEEIRGDFIKFFEQKNHRFVPSAPVVPKDDPTLLFINAGMNQFKDVFLGTGSRNYKRAVNSQKCIRVSGKHNDLEEVGHDTYHHTFFEMLGNWSFGDYYKKEAIEWAWELLTEVWKLPKDKLWATVYKDDDEAEALWKKGTDIAENQVLRFDEEDNFWEMGDTGPCGPCSEIHIDLGPEYCDKTHLANHVCQVNGGCGRFIELWNLVFIQYNRDDYGKLHTLPSKHIDTGMGFERIVAVLQNRRSNYDTDLFKTIILKAAEYARVNYEIATTYQQAALQVIADHIRMLTFSIADGALPSNEGRGYVLRRILRRAARYARKLNLSEPFIYKLVPVVIEKMGGAFPEIYEKQNYIMEVIKSEEESFSKTLDRGIEIFDDLVKQLKAKSKNVIPGEEAFKLYDTYGFPLDLTRIMADEEKLTLDEEGFDREMEKQRERARSAGKFSAQFDHVDNWNILQHCPVSSNFVGYDKLETETNICKFTRKNGTYQIVLVDTPFYAESGGQVADKGKLILDDTELDIVDVQKEGEDTIHICEGPKNLNIIHSRAIAKVDEKHRYPTMYNHTATHLLHKALRMVLGDHVKQAGSLVAPDRLRFDFTHYKKIENSEIEEIERIVNEQIQKDHPLDIIYTDFQEAQNMGAMALFGEKYGEQVRVITIDDFSRELCGGTHVNHTGQIGSFIIVQESSIASGVRRIEAITGPRAVEFAQNNRNIVMDMSTILNVAPQEIPDKIKNINEQLREYERQIQSLQSEHVKTRIDDLISGAEIIGKIKFASDKFENVDMDLLKQAADRFRQKTENGILLLVNLKDNKLNLVCAITDDLISEYGLKAGELVKGVAKATGGGGGGRPHLATAGGKHPEKLGKALDSLKQSLKHIQE